MVTISNTTRYFLSCSISPSFLQFYLLPLQPGTNVHIISIKFRQICCVTVFVFFLIPFRYQLLLMYFFICSQLRGPLKKLAQSAKLAQKLSLLYNLREKSQFDLKESVLLMFVYNVCLKHGKSMSL